MRYGQNDIYNYAISTEKRTYNSVIGKEHFSKVRKNWDDNSKIVAAWWFDRENNCWKNRLNECKGW